MRVLLSVILIVLGLTSESLAGFQIPKSRLAQQIVREWPELLVCEDEFVAVGILRCWAWGHTDFLPQFKGERLQENPFHIEKNYPAGYWKQQDAETFYSHFEKMEGGVHFSDCAFGLSILYKHFGLRSWFTETDLPGPYQTLVEINRRGKKLIVLECATFNLEYLDRVTLEPLDYRDLIHRLGRREHHSIKVVCPPYESMPIWPRMFFSEDRIGGRTPEEIQRPFYQVHDGMFFADRLTDGDILFISPRTIEKFIGTRLYDRETGESTLMSKIVSAGFPPDILYCNLAVNRVNTNPGAQPDYKLIQEIWNARCLGEGERLELLFRP